MNAIYLDYAATTPVHPEVRDAMLPYFTDSFGNPSSAHVFGIRAREAVDKAREQVASLIGCASEEIIFTSGGTESDNYALIGAMQAAASRGRHFIISAVEHHAVLASSEYLAEAGFDYSVVPVNKAGLVNPEDIQQAMLPETVLVSVMHANNEIGTVQPLAEISKITREAGILLHTDAVQTVGRILVKVNELGVDLLSLSSHKLYGPKGVGALYIRRGTRIAPFIHGGSQESGRRAGTENVPGIVGLGAAAALARREMAGDYTRQKSLRDRLLQGIQRKVEDAVLNGDMVNRLPNNVNISIPGVETEAVLAMLDTAGIYASGGSACTSGSLTISHVLHAIGCPAELARGSLRFTLGKWTTEEEIDKVIEVLPAIVKKLRAGSLAYKDKSEEQW